MTNKAAHEKLVHHISRLEGQLASVKAELARANPDCARASTTLRAAARSFSSLRQSFVQCFLDEQYLDHKKQQAHSSEYDALLKVINS